MGRREASVFVPFCYYEAAANMLTNPVLDPFGKIPEFKYCAVKVTKGGALAGAYEFRGRRPAAGAAIGAGALPDCYWFEFLKRPRSWISRATSTGTMVCQLGSPACSFLRTSFGVM